MSKVLNLNTYNSDNFYEVPTVISDLIYNTQSQSPTIIGYDENVMTKTSASEINAGTYNIVFSLKDKINSYWADGTNTDKTVQWTIAKAENIITTDVNRLIVLKGDYKTISVTSSGVDSFIYSYNISDDLTVTVSNKNEIARIYSTGNSTGIISVQAAATSNYNASNIVEVNIYALDPLFDNPNLVTNGTKDIYRLELQAYAAAEGMPIIKYDAGAVSTTDDYYFPMYVVVNATSEDLMTAYNNKLELGTNISNWRFDKEPDAAISNYNLLKEPYNTYFANKQVATSSVDYFMWVTYCKVSGAIIYSNTPIITNGVKLVGQSYYASSWQSFLYPGVPAYDIPYVMTQKIYSK